ncbi:hypothetical protein [Rhizobium laguerreae]|uniref:hypothetical protein n=1 Tax=Rhizobium laguerreae TaxID=1076926 RepID=UPI001C907CB5|nr:hypothetical protein [Rhizobium laguerreae]
MDICWRSILRRTMTISHGDISVFVTRSISAGLLIVAFMVLVVAFLPNIARSRKEVFVEED